MIFSTTVISGCVIVDLDKHEDSRGFFARSWCAKEFEAAGLPPELVQCSVSFNAKAGTLRGMHYQLPPSREGKLVRCVRGAIFDAVTDLRHYEESYLQTVTIRLDEQGGTALFVPPGCAHGFQTLEDDTEVLYQMTDVYQPELGRGFRWDDPRFNIDWPSSSPIIHERDAAYGEFDNSPSPTLDWR